MLSTDDVIEMIIGKAFEIDCPDIEHVGWQPNIRALDKLLIEIV